MAEVPRVQVHPDMRTVQSTVAGIRAVVNEDLVDAGYSPDQLAIQMERSQI